ncbi:hypothetical protein FA13DRAFT_1896440 [Coprinellus micaceus]|uniref:Uncharacterized protein n=1 Tax=Coprinellus micaceus TaxID=71717 RepID=A0A4Y7SVG6_COPMI|nr:hypothetical protein FA13DRAFT_1896440 [Coprinellus micaceus]
MTSMSSPSGIRLHLKPESKHPFEYMDWVYSIVSTGTAPRYPPMPISGELLPSFGWALLPYGHSVSMGIRVCTHADRRLGGKLHTSGPTAKSSEISLATRWLHHHLGSGNDRGWFKMACTAFTPSGAGVKDASTQDQEATLLCATSCYIEIMKSIWVAKEDTYPKRSGEECVEWPKTSARKAVRQMK